jgi:hypothetical protein
MRNILFFILFGFGMLSSCFNTGLKVAERPKDLISKEKMILVYYELTLLESHVQLTYNNAITYHKLMLKSGDALLEKYNFTPKQYRKSFKYYISNPEILEEIKNSVIKKMEKRLIELQNIKVDSIDSTGSNSLTRFYTK